MNCPKCGRPVAPNSEECPECGIIFAKYYSYLKKKQDEDANEQKRKPRSNTKEKGALPNNTKGLGKGKRQGKTPLYSTPTTRKAVSALLLVVICGFAIYLYKRQQMQQQEQERKEYVNNLKSAFSIMTSSEAKCMDMFELYTLQWRKTIKGASDRDMDANFLVSLELVSLNAKLKGLGAIKIVKESKHKLEDILRELNKSQDVYPEAHRKIVTLYGIYSQTEALATSCPSGSLMSYSAKVNDLENEYLRVASELKVLLPQE